MRYTQRDKQKRGVDFEHEFRKSCNAVKCWAYKLFASPSGTPFDFIVLTDNFKYGIELKRLKGYRLNYSVIRQNQRSGLSKFECVSGNISLIIVNVKTENINKTYVLPWNKIADKICSGAKGSIDVRDFRELEKQGGMWDLSVLEGGEVG